MKFILLKDIKVDLTTETKPLVITFTEMTLTFPIDYFDGFEDLPAPALWCNMNGRASSIAFQSKIKGWLAFPLAITGSKYYYRKETEAACKIAAKYKSLTWALRAWAHANRKSFSFLPDGSQLTTSVITLEFEPEYGNLSVFNEDSDQTISALLTTKGWFLILSDIIEKNNDEIIHSGILIHEGYALVMDNKSVGANLVISPSIDYNGNIVEQIQAHIEGLKAVEFDIKRQFAQLRQKQ